MLVQDTIEVIWQLCLFAVGYRYLEFHPDVYSLKDSIDVMIGRLRAKIEVNPKQPKHMISIRGLGYKLINE